VEVVASETSIDQLDAADLYEPVPQLRFQTSGFSVQDYLAHIFNCVSGEW